MKQSSRPGSGLGHLPGSKATISPCREGQGPGQVEREHLIYFPTKEEQEHTLRPSEDLTGFCEAGR